MKRKWLTAVCVLAALLLAAGVGYFQGGRPILTAQMESVAGFPRDRLVVSARLDQNDVLYAEQTFTITNRAGEALSEIVLRVLANGDEYLMLADRVMDIAQVKVNNQDVSFALDEDDPTVLRVAGDWAADETIDLSVVSQSTVSPGGFVSGITLPSLSVYEDGAWRADAWDSLAEVACGPAIDVTLRLEYPAGYEIACGGALTKTQKDGERRVLLWQMDGARDVTLAVSKNAAIRYRAVDGVTVTAMADGAMSANRLLNTAQEALESLEAIGFAYPFPALTIVQAESEREDGRVYSGMIALDAEKDGETRLRRLTRLIARQTFGIQVGNDAWNAPWLSHTLASTAELLAFRQRKGEAAFEARFFEEIEVATRLTRPYGVTVGAGIEHFGGDSEMTQVLRDQGAAMMLGIEEAVGSETFIKALNQYVSDNAYRIADRQALEAALEVVTGSSWTGYLEDELAY